MQIESLGGKGTYRVDEFLQDALALHITPVMLDTFAREYEEILRIRTAQVLAIEALRNSNRDLLNQVWVYFYYTLLWVLTHACRRTLENSLAQLNAEHVEVLVCGGGCVSKKYVLMSNPALQNQLVKARLQNEEMESELVRYKLL